MRNSTLTFLSATLITSLTGSLALADETMNATQLDALITGNTLYVEIPAGAPGVPKGGTAPIFYSKGGAAAAQLPGGPKLVGKWAFKENNYCIDWDNGPKNSCTKLVRRADGFIVVDAAKNEPRGIVTRIATGNPEKL